MKTPKQLSPAQKRTIDAVKACDGNMAEAARRLGVTAPTVRKHCMAAEKKGHKIYRQPWGSNKDGPPKVLETPSEFEMDSLPEEIIPEELWQERKVKYQRKAAREEAEKLINVRVKDDKPIAIHFFGDPHVDDNGTDLAALEEHTQLINRTPGMYGANVGDTTNNWVGRLARLYGEQSTSAEEAWALAEYWIKMCEKWIFIIGGNHDAWSGAGDPLKWIRGRVHYGPSMVRLNLNFPGADPIRVNARHDFAGKSMWNPAHGSMKAAQMGFRDHLLINGHRHTSGYGVVKCPNSGVVSHCVQVASYKVYDRFAKERGFVDQHLSPCATVILDPWSNHRAEQIKLFWEPGEAAEFLTWKRSK